MFLSHALRSEWRADMIGRSYTIECWLYLNPLAVDAAPRCILSFARQAEAEPGRGFEVSIRNGKSYLG
jgi:hypothetical protein